MVLHKMHIVVECILVHLKKVKYCEKFVFITLFKKVNIHVNKCYYFILMMMMAFNSRKSEIQFLKLLKYFIFSVSKLLFILSSVTTVVGKNADSTVVQMKIEFRNAVLKHVNGKCGRKNCTSCGNYLIHEWIVRKSGERGASTHRCL